MYISLYVILFVGYLFWFCIQYKLNGGVSEFIAKCCSITVTLIWIVTYYIESIYMSSNGFTNVLHMDTNLHLIYMVITAVTLIFILFSYSFAPFIIHGGISCCAVYSWEKWTLWYVGISCGII